MPICVHDLLRPLIQPEKFHRLGGLAIFVVQEVEHRLNVLVAHRLLDDFRNRRRPVSTEGAR